MSVTANRTAALAARALSGGRVRSLDLTLARGEILGIAGLLGSGSDEVPYLLFGAQQAAGGTIESGGRSLAAPAMRPKRAIELGIGLVPADRGRDGLAGSLTVWENELFLVSRRYFRHGWTWKSRARSDARERAARFGIRPPGPGHVVAALSGGNQQKVLIAKWCEIEPRVLLLHEPTQGVDVGAREDIHQTMRQLKAAGTAIVWVTMDYGEMAEMADRVLVMGQGSPVAELTGEDVTASMIALKTSTA
jgi:ribose transport system ATP-binding protein